MTSGPSSSRRALLAAATGSLAATSGCLGELRNLVGRERTGQLSLTIATPPAGDDPYATRIATQLGDNLEEAGIDTDVDPVRPDVLFRETLINHDFDMYVSRYPSRNDPDELRSMLYSAYAEESGWQNPFGFSDLTLDDLLDEQRTVGEGDRVDRVHEIQRRVAREQPFTAVCFPDYIGGVRNDRFDGWPPQGPKDPTDYLGLDGVGEEPTLQLLLRNDRITRNRNPIAAEYRDRGSLMGLLYDPLVQFPQDSIEPINWTAETITWNDAEETLSATVRLRETPWHSGEALTAADVAFTYEFLRDTSLGSFDTPVPTPWLRGRISLVDSIRTHSDRSLRIDFTTGTRSAARRALSVPILPEHVWRERAESADIAGVDIIGRTTEALIDANEAAIGSGPFRFVDAETDQSLSLERFPEHFLYMGNDDGIPEQFTGGPPFENIEFTVTPSHDAAVQVLTENGADATADGLQASVVPRIVRDGDVSLTIRRSDRFYHVGYNCRRAPLTDPNFRRAVARHIDRETIVSESLGGYGVPTETPLTGQWIPDELRWDGEATLPFLGEDDTLDSEAAREAFREAGYQYDDGALVTRAGT